MAKTLQRPTTDEPPLVFVSYSKHDRSWLDVYLLRHLKALEQEGMITSWTDSDIDPGGEWLPRIVQAMKDAEVAVCMISANYLATAFCVKEEIPYLLERQSKDGLEVIFVLLSPVNLEPHPWLSSRQMLPRKGKSVSVDYKGREDEVFAAISQHITKVLNDRLPAPRALEVSSLIRQVLQQLEQQVATQTSEVRHAVETDPALSFEEVEAPAWPALPEDQVNIWRLPETGAELFGRSAELKLLNDAWASETTNVVTLVAWGGVGKSTLVNKWLEGLRADNWRGAGPVLGWTFHSQGTGERVTSADQFIDHALRFFEDPEPEAGSPWAKGERLADLARKNRALLILDGLEPLQDRYQGIKDPALQRLIEELARDNTGLCVITTRETVSELADFPDSVIARDLEQISPEAGRALLRVKGVRGTDAELEQASELFGNHALAINLLANWLRAIEGQPIAKAHDIPDLEIPLEKGRHPRRVMAALAQRFGEDRAEVDVLRLLGLFDRPATKSAVDAVRATPPIPGLTNHLSGLDEAGWLRLLERLREVGLVAPASSHAPDDVDAHPLVREHFGEELRQKHPEAWRAGHARVYEYFKGLPEKHQPDTLEELAPLFQAVFHGCQAERYDDAYHEVYRARIRRQNEHYVVRKLGAFGADLSAIGGFFEGSWENPVSQLDEESRGWLLNAAGYRLRALGRLKEAAQPMRVSLEMGVEQEDWINAAIRAQNLSELQLTLGEVAEAIALAEHSVDYADRSHDGRQRILRRTTLANARYQAGDRAQAEALFQEAEQHPDYPRLYSLRGYQYCELLLDLGRHTEVRDRAAYAIEIARQNNWLLDVALDHLSLGRAELMAYEADRSGDPTKVNSHLNEAVDGLRQAGHIEFIGRGLLACAAYFRIIEQFDRARRDLGEVIRIATRSGMRLHECDAHLELARLELARGHREAARPHLTRAEELVAATGYHRRDKDLEELKAALG